MTDLDHIRAVAMLLPETEERDAEGGCAFLVVGRVYAEVRDGALHVRADALPGEQPEGDVAAWKSVALGEEVDGVLVEDLIARGWEMTAPRRLLEAGGR